jgi:arylesterase/paraoxonase
MWKRFAVAALVLLVVVAAIALDSMRRAGEFLTLTPQPLDCREVTGVIGPEDITVDRARNVAYISSTDSRTFMKNGAGSGALYRYALGDEKPTQIYTQSDGRFHPHGIGFWSDDNGPDLLYVVNHQTQTSHSIEVFEIDASGGAKHVKTLSDPSLISPNDVVAVARNELYVTNDHGVGRGPGQLFEDVLRRKRAQIVHVRDGRFETLVRELAYANGINASKDGKTIYVAESTGRSMRTYARAAADGGLELQATIELEMAADNIELAPDGSLYVAGHPKALTFLRHVSDASVLSPSQVDRITKGKVERVYLDLGQQLGAATVAAPFGEHLLIGSVFADHFLDCKLAASP